MLRVGVLEIPEKNGFDFEIEKNLSEAIRERIEKTKKNSEKELRCAAYALLEKMLCESFPNAKMPQIFYTDQGKPHFEGSEIENKSCHFSISHNRRVVAVAISDKAVGVDIQAPARNPKSEQRLRDRFGRYFSALEGKDIEALPIDLSFFEIKDAKIIKTDANRISKPDRDNSFLESWTALEASMKLDGGGFSAIGSVEKIIKEVQIRTVFLKMNSGEYTLTVASR